MPRSTPRKSWLVKGLVGLMALNAVNAAAVNLHARQDDGSDQEQPQPTGLSREDKCKLPWGRASPDEDKSTWIDSGAEAFLSDFLDGHGPLSWSRDLLTQTGAGGSQGGTQYSCIDVDSTTCGPPDDCLTYEPVEAFFIHTQMSNLFAALQKLQTRHIKDAVVAISSDIHQIVQTFGVVKDDGSAAVLKGLLAVVGSLSGVAGAAGGAGSASAPFAGAALSLFSAAVGYGSPDPPKTAEAVQGEITDKYGQMFTLAMGQINETVKVIFGGKEASLPNFKRRFVVDLDQNLRNIQKDSIHQYFQDGIWLDPEAFGDAINIYADNTKAKMLELSMIQAMKDNEYPYQLVIRPRTGGQPAFGDDGIDEDWCGARKNCHWYDDHCLCIEQVVSTGGMFGASSNPIADDVVDKMKKYTQDFNEALENNYNCVKDGWVEQDTPVKAGDRENPPPFDPQNLPPNYFKCFWNLDVTGSMKSPDA